MILNYLIHIYSNAQFGPNLEKELMWQGIANRNRKIFKLIIFYF